eukprot:12887483-Heterocapsa_arctica.AAC.1
MYEHPRPHQQSGAAFLGFPRPPPAPPPRPEPVASPILLEAPPWCAYHMWASDNMECRQCHNVRNYWRLHGHTN